MNPLRKPNLIRSSSGFSSSVSMAGAGLRAQVLPGGRTILTATPSRARGGGVGHPFKLTGITEPEHAYIRVSLGLVDNLIPKIDGVFLSFQIGTPPAPPKIEVHGPSGQVWLKCTLDAAGTITGVVVETGETMPADTMSTAYRLLGTFTGISGEFTSVLSVLRTNQSHRRCNGTSTWGSA